MRSHTTTTTTTTIDDAGDVDDHGDEVGNQSIEVYPDGGTAETIEAEGHSPPPLPSILPPVTKELRDGRRLEPSIGGSTKTRKKKIDGVPVCLLVVLAGFAIGVIAYALVIHRQNSDDDDPRFLPPYETPSSSPSPSTPASGGRMK